MDMKEIRQEVETTYEKVKSLAGWSVDKNVVLTMTSYYITSDREFDAASLNRAMDELKSKTGWLSPLRGSLLPMMAAFLDQPGTAIADEIDRLFTKQQVLKNVGFRNTIHSYIAALLLTDTVESYEKEARQAKKLYDAMKKHHFFLTSDDDYAYAVLLGKKNENTVKHAKSMRTYYDALRSESFRAGNELQWMSQVMTYKQIDFNPQNVKRSFEILSLFKKETKVKPVHYPMIGFLTIHGTMDTELKTIIQLTRELEQSKPFKWHKEMALSMAIGYYMHNLMGDADVVHASLSTSIEMIIQAQQALMIATMAALVASSANTSTTQ